MIIEFTDWNVKYKTYQKCVKFRALYLINVTKRPQTVFSSFIYQVSKGEVAFQVAKDSVKKSQN